MSSTPASPQDPSPARRPQPESVSDLFFSFSFLALQGFGGVLPVVQRELVEKKKWLTREEFVEEWSVAQVMPGPNVVNLAMTIGGRYFGLRGAMAALAGMLAFPLIVVLCLGLIYGHFSANPQVAGALRGMAAVAAGLIAGSGLKLAGALKSNVLGIVWCSLFAALSFAATAWLRVPLGYVLLVMGGLACALAYTKLGRPRA